MIKNLAKFNRFRTINPCTNEIVKEFPFISDSDVEKVLNKAEEGFIKNKRRSFEERGHLLNESAIKLREGADEMAAMMAQEMGKPFTAGRAEVLKSAAHCEYFALEAPAILQPRTIQTPYKKAYVLHQPIGPIFNIMPWNFPVWLPLKAGVPNLMLGNTIILKHSPTVPQSALLLQKALIDAGFNSGEFLNIFIEQDQCERVIGDRRVAGLTLTGSSAAGCALSSLAGKYIKKSVMELGGSDPFIVLKDADIQNAAKIGATARLFNTGQVCISAKRFIIVESVYNEFMDALKREISNFKIGDPMEEGINMGPMARRDLMDQLKNQVNETIKLGAKMVYGDQVQLKDFTPLEKGNYMTPVILENIPHNSPAFNEEIFGPVFCMFKVKDELEAIKLANETIYGLGGAVFSADIMTAERVASSLDTGSVWINDFNKTDSKLPAGGIKESGFGRECSEEGIMEFANHKTIVINQLF